MPADYDVAGTFDYQPISAKLGGLMELASQSRSDLRAAQQAVTAAKSSLTLAQANGKQVRQAVGTRRLP